MTVGVAVTPLVHTEGVTAASVPHGTASGYSYHGCRCEECKAYKRRTDRARYERKIGRPVRVPMSAEELSRKNVARATAWQKANPERVKELRAAYRERNRAKLRKQSLERYYRLMAEDPERIRKARRDWQKTEKGRRYKRYIETLRRRGVPYTEEALDWIASLVDPVCFYCGEPATEIDHLTPISRGGTGELSNLASSCRSCNARKRDLTVDEFIERKESGNA